MGTNVHTYLRKKGTNPFADAIGRSESGDLTVDVGRVINVLGEPSAANFDQVRDFTRTVGTGQVRVDDLRNYGKDYASSTGGDADMAYTYTWRPPIHEGFEKQAFNSAIEAFEIKEQGQAQAARIAQEGRDRARQTNFGAELSTANRQALSSSEDNARGQEGGTPDVVLSSDPGPDSGLTGSNGNARRRRAQFSGAGLRI